MDELRIATRKSRLALWQASFIKSELQRRHQGLRIELVGMTTEGDRRLDARLSAIGGKGLFIKALEAALLRGDADLAVHSMKDLPAAVDSRFALAAIGYRDDARDAWVSPHGTFNSVPAGATVGSSSLRRQAQILAARPDLKVVRYEATSIPVCASWTRANWTPSFWPRPVWRAWDGQTASPRR